MSIRFDDSNTHKERKKDNRVAAISDIKTKCITHCEEMCFVKANVTVGENAAQLIGR